MIDTSNYTMDTPVLIKIMDNPGTFIPELSTRTPLETYASINQVISIMNRTGLSIQFPKQSEEREISKKIEDLLLEYKEKCEIAESKGYIVENDVETALDTIQYINDSQMTKEELEEESNSHIFDCSKLAKRIYEDLSGSELDHIFETDAYTHDKDLIKEAELRRKAEDRVHKFKHESLVDRHNFDVIYIKTNNFKVNFDDPFYTDDEEIQFYIGEN